MDGLAERDAGDRRGRLYRCRRMKEVISTRQTPSYQLWLLKKQYPPPPTRLPVSDRPPSHQLTDESKTALFLFITHPSHYALHTSITILHSIAARSLSGCRQ